MKHNTYIAIGDVHGCYKELEYLYNVIRSRWPKDARLVFLGDYIDRGDSSIEVLKLLLRFQKDDPSIVFLRGNHEQEFLLSGSTDDPALIQHGCEQYIQLLQSTKIYLETENILFVHGGPAHTEKDISKQDPRSLLWNYYPDTLGYRGKTVIKGHTNVSRVFREENIIYVDTGCCFGGALSAAVIQDNAERDILEIMAVPRLLPADEFGVDQSEPHQLGVVITNYIEDGRL